MSADHVLFANEIETFDPKLPSAQAVAITGDRIVAVGDRDHIEEWIGDATQVHHIDGVILPGLTDSHLHPVWGVTDLARGTDLSHAQSPDDVVALLREAESVGSEQWIFGWGLDPNIFADDIDSHFLEEHFPDRPIYLRLFDAHSALASPAALRCAGVTGQEKFADKSRVVTNDQGEPTGLLLELSAMGLMQAVLPEPTLEQVVADVGKVLNDLADQGVVTGHVMDFGGQSRQYMEALEAQGPLPLNLRFSPMCTPAMGRDDWKELVQLQRTGGMNWMIEGIKFFIDGTIDNGTAWLESPDCYGESTESVWTDPAGYREALAYFIAKDIPTATHAIGDAGVLYALESIAAARKPGSQVPHRIEHLETVPTETLERFAEVGAVASMQPTHGTHFTLADGSDNWSIRLGEERAARGWRCRDVRDRGIVLALGSDWPVAPSDPLAVMADAQLRRPVLEPDVTPVQPEQALTVREAYEGYTTHAAKAAGHEAQAGMVRAGMVADLTILEHNPLRLTPTEQVKNQVMMTFVHGRQRTTVRSTVS